MPKVKVPKVEQPKPVIRPEEASDTGAIARPRGQESLISTGPGGLRKKARGVKASLLGE